LGADAIAMALTVGSAEQALLLSDLGALIREAETAGLPVVVHSYPCGQLIPADERTSVARVGYAARLAMELGVDIVKTFYTGSAESFAQVVEMAAPALVVAAGGPRMETDGDVLRMAYDVVHAGAAGITFGRNIWQSANVLQVSHALVDIVHHGGSVDEVIGLLASGQGG
jgi:class I fructose-bisphosphate aldolase